ncbi:phosphate ABC transporter substrate-binding protein [Stutzerimonas azotifigens]|uniref:phosphate ABC transporter substrate-binding protein n=1 Tax=Stutzerimonas azotifigens TaxID=291995 RepID=UPI0004875E86|nr:phosphate ABC transporter substrate-binding protein [Stutzerimonas azotifigens]
MTVIRTRTFPRRGTLVSSLAALTLLAALQPAFAATGAEALAARDARNKEASARLMGPSDSPPAPPTAHYNHIITFGQSLASAAEGWPALSREPGYDNLMLGEATRSATYSGPRFVPVGEAAFKPLRAVVQAKADAKVLLGDEQTAEFEEHAQDEGESVEVGALNMARRLYLRDKGASADPQHLFVASNAATSGRSLAQLSHTGGTDEYQRVIQAVQQARALAESGNTRYAVSALFWLQGEFDYAEVNGGVNDKLRYKAGLRKLREDLNTDIAAITGQPQAPAFLSYQTDAKSSKDPDSLAIGMAQWELANEEPHWYLVGPVYPYTDKGTHLSSNGYRWFGQMLGKVYHRVVVEGRGWRPLSPLGASHDGREVLVDFHVPYPPLAFDKPYIAHQARDIPDRGFELHDERGRVPLARVELAADTVVRLTASRELVGTPRVVYAGKRAGGAGALRDSDPTVADAVYEYRAEAGMWRSENVAERVGKPYPLQNWSIAFELSAEPASP